MMEPLKHKVQLLEYVPYKSLQFKLGGEENIFGKLANEDGDGMRVTGSRGVRPS